MKKIVSLLMAFVLVFSCMVQVFAEDKTYIYVSTTGSDENPGTFSKPVASLSKACELAAGGNAVINIMGGTYNITEKAVLSGSNITVKAYNDESVVISGGYTLDAAAFNKVTDTAVLDRITTKSAKDKIVCIDLKAAGVEDLGAINMYGFDYPENSHMPQLMVNDELQILARYPDNDFLLIDEVINSGPGKNTDKNLHMETVLSYKGKGFTIRVNDDRISKWTMADDVWMFGYFSNDWADAFLHAEIDFENKNAISTEYPSVYGCRENQRFYFVNLLEEISTPGEFYIDRASGFMYYYPEADLTAKDSIELITFKDYILDINNAENVQIENISFRSSLDIGVYMSESKNVTISDCNFSNIVGDAVYMKNCYDSAIIYCVLENLGSRAVNMTCGDREKLTPGNCSVENCIIRNTQKVRQTVAAVNINGIGNKASHNEIYDCNHIAIWYTGNDIIVEYNDIYNVCKSTADTGAIYTGRHWEARGNEIRYNYIHDMNIIDTKTGMKVQAVYLDDGHSSTKVYGNIIKDVPSVALFGGGRHNTFENNIIIGCEEPFVFDARFTTWDTTDMYKNLDAMPYTSEAWAEKYPELVGIKDDEPEIPKHNTIKNNVSYDSPGYNLNDLVKEYAIEIKPDLELRGTDVFVDYKGGDLTLKEDCEVFTKLPDFKAIDFKAIGVQEKAEKAKTAEDVVTQSVILKLNTPTAYVFGNKTTVDPENSAVMPQIINDRTLVPVRFIAESLGGEVSWDDETKKVGIALGDKTIELVLGDTKLSVNGSVSELDVPAQSVEGRTMLPLRAVTESLGMKVFWDNRGLIAVSSADILAAEDTALIEEIISMF